jgi:hypothetical protein
MEAGLELFPISPSANLESSSLIRFKLRRVLHWAIEKQSRLLGNNLAEDTESLTIARRKLPTHLTSSHILSSFNMAAKSQIDVLVYGLGG